MKTSVLVDRDGRPLAVVIAPANVPDYQLMAGTLDAIVPLRPLPAAGTPHELYGDRGYDYSACDTAAAVRGYTTRIGPKGGGWMRVGVPPPSPPPQYRRRRWIVERTLAWLSKCRALLVRYEKKAANYLGFVRVTCILLWYRRAKRQTG